MDIESWSHFFIPVSHLTFFHSTGTDHSHCRVGLWHRPYHPFLVSATNWNWHKTLNNYLNPFILERTEFEFINILRIWYILHETDSKGCYKISHVVIVVILNNSTGSISLVRIYNDCFERPATASKTSHGHKNFKCQTVWSTLDQSLHLKNLKCRGDFSPFIHLCQLVLSPWRSCKIVWSRGGQCKGINWMDTKNSPDLESVKDELRLLTKSDQFYSRIKSLLFCLKQLVLQHYKIRKKCFRDPAISKLKTVANWKCEKYFISKNFHDF